MPLAAVVAEAILGFCDVDEKLFGPNHDQEVFPVAAPVKLRVEPAQMGLLEPAEMEVGGELTVTVVETHVETPQGDVKFRTKYVVLLVGDTVMDAPVPTKVPPQEPVNHCEVALPPVAVSVVEPPEQIVVFPVIAVGAVAD